MSTSNPKIAHIWTTFYSDHTVMKRMMLLAESQLDSGCDVTFIVGHHASHEFIEQTRSRGFSVKQISSLRKYISPHHDIQALFHLMFYLRQNRFDLVHTHQAKAGILGRFAAALAGVGHTIHTVYGATFAPSLSRTRNCLFRVLERIAGLATDRFIFVGRDLRDAYVAAGVCPIRKTCVIYGGRNLEPFLQTSQLPESERAARRQTLGLDHHTILLGNVSRIVPWKGHKYGLQVVHALKQKNYNVKYMIVGEALLSSEKLYKNELITVARSLGIEEDVIFTGWQKDTPLYYSIFDIYLLTSMPFEGLPGAVLEAVLSGLPVAGFDCFGLREIKDDSIFIVPMKDTSGLVEVVERLIRQLPLLHRSRSAHLDQFREIASRFTFPQMIDQTHDLYADLLGHV